MSAVIATNRLVWPLIRFYYINNKTKQNCSVFPTTQKNIIVLLVLGGLFFKEKKMHEHCTFIQNFPLSRLLYKHVVSVSPSCTVKVWWSCLSCLTRNSKAHLRTFADLLWQLWIWFWMNFRRDFCCQGSRWQRMPDDVFPLCWVFICDWLATLVLLFESSQHIQQPIYCGWKN